MLIDRARAPAWRASTVTRNFLPRRSRLRAALDKRTVIETVSASSTRLTARPIRKVRLPILDRADSSSLPADAARTETTTRPVREARRLTAAVGLISPMLALATTGALSSPEVDRVRASPSIGADPSP